MWTISLVLVAAGSLWTLSDAQDLLVTTSYGPVMGIYDELSQTRSFLGIPYGLVDGDNRFQAPRTPEIWSETLLVQQFAQSCPQWKNGEVVGTENCLVLNVFSPHDGVGLPVLMHVHSGELQRGSATPAAYGPQRLVNRGVVLVVPNYRVGPLGFLCLRHPAAPGNAGLKDLQLALEWVRNNIRAFGGDPDNIALSGEGTGGGAAGLLAISPTTQGMVSKLIIESGSPLSPRILDRTPTIRADSFVRALAVEYQNATEEDEIDYDFLREIQVADIVEMSNARNEEFKVCVESSRNNSEPFLLAPPYHILRAGNFSDIVAMIGFASGAGMREAASQSTAAMENLNTDYYSLLPDDLVFPSSATRRNAALRIRNQYFGDEEITIEHREEYMKYYTDAFYLGPILRVGRLLAVQGSVFLYEFGYDGVLNYAKRALSEQLSGAARGDIAGYVFVHEDEPDPLLTDDSYVVELVTDLWVNFITNGTPTWSEEAEENAWPPLTSEAESVLNITEPRPQLHDQVHPERLALWDDLYANNYIDCPNSSRPSALLIPHLFLAMVVLAAAAFLAVPSM